MLNEVITSQAKAVAGMVKFQNPIPLNINTYLDLFSC